MNLEQIVRDLKGSVDLSFDRKREAQYFYMDTKYIHFGLDGRRLATESYLLKIQYAPKPENVEEYTCSELQLQIDDGPSVIVPELNNWACVFNPMLSGSDQRPLWGIPQDKFVNLRDSEGKALPFTIRYAIYNSFIDFHSFNDAFGRPMKFGKGIQDLKEIGQRIIHPASFVEASIKFGSEISPNSSFRNGEVSLELKGLSLVNGFPCALVGYDAGESNLKMIIPVSPDKDSVSAGGSQYKGDIYVDLTTGWVRKATLDEYMVIETSIPDSPSKINQYTTRHILLRLIS